MINIDYIKNYLKDKCNTEVISNVYKDAKTKLDLKCSCGNVFHIGWNKIKQGKYVCNICGRKQRWVDNRPFMFEKIKNFVNLTNCKLLSDSYIKNNEKLKFQCTCGNIFEATWQQFLGNKKGAKRQCNDCGIRLKANGYESKGEKRIRDFLNKNNIKFVAEQTFEDCIYIQKLRFDFYLPNNNIVIEFMGEQHYKPVSFGGIDLEKSIEKYNKTVIRDKIKFNYCKEKNIKIIYIRYDEYDKIEEILYDIV